MTELPAVWRSASLGDLLVEPLLNGRSVPTRPGGFPVLRLTALKGGHVDLDERKEGAWSAAEARPYLVREGDFLVARGNGSLALVGRGGLVGPVNAPVAFPDTLIRVRPDSRVVDRRFLALLWSSEIVRRQIESQARTTAGIYKVNQQHLRQIRLPVPSLDEQRRIVDILEDHLSRLDAGVRQMKTLESRLGEWSRSVLLAAVTGGPPRKGTSWTQVDWGGPAAPDIELPDGWTWSQWQEIGTSQNGRLFPSSDYCSDGVRLLRPGNLSRTGRLDWSEAATRRMPATYADSHRSFLLESGDLVMNLTAQSLKDEFLGRVCIIGETDVALLNQRIARLRSCQVEPTYAWAVFRSPIFREYVKSLNTGSLIQHMFVKQINRYWLPVPPLGVQREIVTRLSDLTDVAGRLGEALVAARVRADVLRRALLAAAFAGRLTGHSSDVDRVKELAGV